MKRDLPVTRVALLLPLAVALLAGNSSLAAERGVLPQDPSVFDVKRDFGAKGDGTTNEQWAMQA